MGKKNRLIDHYLPADYIDKFTKRVEPATLTADKLFDYMFVEFPKPVIWLLALRRKLVSPFGLKSSVSFRNLIKERNDEEIILGLDDKHLSFWVSVYCSQPAGGKQDAEVSTVVWFNNTLGRVYFAFIYIFHKLIVGCLLRRAIRLSRLSA